MVIRVVTLLVALIASTTGGARGAAPFVPLLAPGDAVPPFALIAQNGRPFSLADLHGNAVAVSFVYTRCADARMCPLVAAKFGRAQQLLGRLPIRLVIFTLDPTFDTPSVLARYGHAFGQDPRRWTLATASPVVTEALAERFGIATSTIRPGVIVHTEGLMIVGPDGRLAQSIYGNDWTPASLVDAARSTLPGKSDPLVGFRGWLSSAMERCGAGNIALGGAAMLGILAFACVAVGGAFWLAFRGSLAGDA